MFQRCYRHAVVQVAIERDIIVGAFADEVYACDISSHDVIFTSVEEYEDHIKDHSAYHQKAEDEKSPNCSAFIDARRRGRIALQKNYVCERLADENMAERILRNFMLIVIRARLR